MLKYKSIRHALYAIILLFATGLGLQAFLGPFSLALLEYPFNIVIIVTVLLLAFAMCKWWTRAWLTSFLCSGATALATIFFIGALSLVLGLTLQTSENKATDTASLLGIRQMTTYYPFVLSYLYLIIVLSFTVVQRLIADAGKWSVASIGFFLNHAGLLLLLISTGLGTADKKDLRLSIMEGHSANKALNRNNKAEDLPFTIVLKDFCMDSYMPKLAIMNRLTNAFVPEGKPQFWDVDTLQGQFELQGHQFSILKYYPHALKIGEVFAQSTNIATPPAIKICNTDGTQCAWLSCGNKRQMYTTMPLGTDRSVVMLPPEAKSFASQISILYNNSTRNARIAVNHPIKIGAWSIYQTTYDENAGEASKISGMQMIYDPWQWLTQLGFAMLILGAISLFWGHGIKKEEHGLE
ncbi:MAG: cytochrome c biogenesis protein ResB [Bacteroidales bacterium]